MATMEIAAEARVDAPLLCLDRQTACAGCGDVLVPGRVVTLDEKNFDCFTERGADFVAVDFWASWCGPCKTMSAQFAEAAHELAGIVAFGTLDTEAFPLIGAIHDLRSIPTVIVFRGGREIGRMCGAVDAAHLVDWIDDVICGVP